MTGTLNILVVDNEKLVAESIVEMLEMHGYGAWGYYSAEAALKEFREGKNNYDVIITDINMPKMDGYNFIEEVRKSDIGNTKILVLTGYGSIDSAVKAIKLGASGYYEKDRDPELLLFEIKKIAENIYLQKKMSNLEERLSTVVDDFYLLGSRNKDVRNIFALAKQVAPKDVNVLITGESGTGKEILARFIHQNSLRKKKRFLSINCSAIPDTLFESEMFGHVKGSFTDAVADKKGFFEQSEGGTLLLDEIGEMRVSNQVKLLKVLEEKSYCPVGSADFKNADCRIISATNQVLQNKIDSGTFRSDLYYRINTVELDLPPLRERREDILDFVEIYRKFFNKKYQTNITDITEETNRILLEYDWPGNIRELRQVVERCVLFSQENTIDKEDLLAQGMGKKEAGSFREGASAGSAALTKSYRDAKRDFDKKYFINALNAVDYNVTELAKMSGLNRTHLYQKIKSLGIDLK